MIAQTVALAILSPVFLQRRDDPPPRALEHFSDKPNRASIVNVVSTGSREWQRKAFSEKKSREKLEANISWTLD